MTNLEGVTAVHSAGLGELVRSYVTTTPQGGFVQCCTSAGTCASSSMPPAC